MSRPLQIVWNYKRSDGFSRYISYKSAPDSPKGFFLLQIVCFSKRFSDCGRFQVAARYYLGPQNRPTLQKHKPFCKNQVHARADAIVWATWNRLQSLNRLEKQTIWSKSCPVPPCGTGKSSKSLSMRYCSAIGKLLSNRKIAQQSCSAIHFEIA